MNDLHQSPMPIKNRLTSRSLRQSKRGLRGIPAAHPLSVGYIEAARKEPAPDDLLASLQPKLRRRAADIVKSKKRVADHGEVFTPAWMVDAMLDLVQAEVDRLDARFLEPACGTGNFIIEIVRRKLAAVHAKYGHHDFDRRQYSLVAIMSVYGVELLADNIAECRASVLEVLAEYLQLEDTDNLYVAASFVLSQNLIHGNAMTMQAATGEPITFAEWGYLGKGRFQRRDFRFDVLTQSASFSAEDSLFGHLGKHEIFQPVRAYPPATIAELALAGRSPIESKE